MKRIILIIFFLIASSGFVLAADDVTPAKPDFSKMDSAMRGKIKSIAADPADQSGSAELTIINSAGKDIIFSIVATTKIYNSTFQPLSLTEIPPDSTVVVTYKTTPEGAKEVKSIKVF